MPAAAEKICNTWLVPIAESGAKPDSTISGTENSGPPAPENPEPNPAAAPINSKSQGRKGYEAESTSAGRGTNTYTPAKIISAAMMRISSTPSTAELAIAPR